MNNSQTVDIIFNLLKEKNISQKNFANEIGVTQQVVSDWKSRRNNSYQKYISQIADYLEVPIDYFFCQTDCEETCANAMCYGVNNQNNASIKGDNPVTSTMHKPPIFRLFADLSGIFLCSQCRF